MNPEYNDYLQEVLESSNAPDNLFPELLFNPICNNFGDIYFTQDPKDYGSDAVKVDPRFTVANLNKIRPKVKRIEKYLETVALYDDYMDYLVSKYGGSSIFNACYEAGDVTEFVPLERPQLKRNSPYRKLLKCGIIPSIRTLSVDTVGVYDRAFEICQLYKDTPEPGEPDYDIDKAMDVKLSKSDLKMMRERNVMITRYNRIQNLYKHGSGISPVREGIDFIDHYYGNMGATVLKSGQELNDIEEGGLVDRAQRMEDRKYLTEGQLIEEGMMKSGNRFYQGFQIEDSMEKMKEQFIMDIAETYGIDAIETFGKNMSKRTVKAATSKFGERYANMSPKKIRKMKKKEEKIRKAQNKKLEAHDQLRNILMNNKIISDTRKRGYTVRFKDMRY